jgi:hypothetical protein
LTAAASRSPRRDSLLAGLPHLLLGVFVASGKLAGILYPQASTLATLSAASLVFFLILSVAVAAYAWRRGWPLWTASWYSYAFWLLVIALAYLAYLPGLYLLGAGNWILNAILLVGSIAAIGLVYMILFRFSRLHALLLGLFLLPVASQLGLESIPNAWEAFIALFFGLLAALASAYAILSLNWPRSVAGALLANLFAGAALTYVCFYQAEIPGFYGDTFAEALLAFLGYFGAVLALYLGPWALWDGYDLARRKLR